MLKRIFTACILAMAMVACVSPGTALPTSIDANLAYSLAAVTAVRLSAADAVTSGSISVTAAQQVLDLSDQARTIIDAARLAHGVGDDTTASTKLQIVTQLLIQLQTYAIQKGATR